MAKTIIDDELSSIISQIISSPLIEDGDKEVFRRQARDAMQVYNRSRAFMTLLRFYLILGGIVIILCIVFACMGQPAAAWATTLTIDIIGILLFGILTGVFRSRYRARISNLTEDFQTKTRNKNVKYAVVPMVCVIGPYLGGYGGLNVRIQSQNYDGVLPTYSSLALTFFENRKGGTFEVEMKNKRGKFSLDASECALVIGEINSGAIVFRKIPVKVDPSAFAESTPKPVSASSVPASSPAAQAAVAPVPAKPVVVDQTPNELLDERRFDELGDPLSIPKGKVGFFMLKDGIHDMLKPGDYAFSINEFPRLKSADPNAFENRQARLVLLDPERIYQIPWKLDGDIHAKGDVEFKISNARLFLNSVLEDDLRLKALFEMQVQDILKPLLIKEFRATKSDDFEFIEKNLLKALSGALDRMGLHIEFIGISAFWKEEVEPAQSDRHCVHCGKAIPSDSVFCSYCGKQQAQNICPNCGAVLPEDAAFCSKCGAKRGM